MINDQAAGLGGRVVQGTIRDSLHMIDVWSSQDGGQRPDIIVTDAGSYSDLVFGLVSPPSRAGGSAPRPTTGR